MGDIAALGNENYLLIPLDEKPFEIDANSRVVTVPADFAKCGAVRNDNLCEIATFRVARYYDFQDLADCEIAIQWTNALGEEGLSWAFGKDVAGEPGYIRFGWALTEAVTKNIGNVKFAVRFFRKTEGSNKFDYLLNTLPAVITVKDTLAVGEDAVEEKNVMDLFQKVVINSQNPMYAQPAQPSFAAAAGGVDFGSNAQAAINNDTNTLELTAMAVTKDNSNIEYEWLYCPSDVPDKVINLTNNIGELTSIGHDTSAYRINNEHYVAVNPVPETKTLAKYYIFKDGAYQLFNGEWNKEELEGKLFVKQTQLSFEDGDYLVTGQYQVKATSKLIEENNSPNSSEMTSNKVSILPPNPIEIQEDLPQHIFTGESLQFVLAPDARNPEMSYAWKKKTSKEGNFETISDVEEFGYTPGQPGWYQTTASAQLNRTTLTKDSQVCFVSDHAITPKVKTYEYSLDGGKNWTELNENDVIDITDPAGYKIIWLKLTVNEDDLTEFNSDKDNLTYRWRIIQNDQNIVQEVTEDLIAKNDIVYFETEYNTNILKVRQMDPTDSVFNVYCTITNAFQGEEKSVDTFAENRPFSIC